MLKLKIAEACKMPDGRLRFVCEFYKEGYGVQRPTFYFDNGVSDEVMMQEMRDKIEHQESLNKKPRQPKQLGQYLDMEL
jgi:hypothetical protein